MKIALRISVVLLAAGCAASNPHRTNQAIYPPRSPDSVEVFFSKPRRAYEVIGFIEATGDQFANLDDLQQKLVNRAARIGGDAVIVRSEDNYLESIKTGNGMETGTRRRLTGDVIVFDRRN